MCFVNMQIKSGKKYGITHNIASYGADSWRQGFGEAWVVESPTLDALRLRMGFSTTSASPMRASDGQDMAITASRWELMSLREHMLKVARDFHPLDSAHVGESNESAEGLILSSGTFLYDRHAIHLW